MAQSAYKYEIDKSSYDYFNRRFSALKTERQSFISHWKDLAQFIKPRRGRWFLEDRNKGDDRYNKIVHNAATLAHRIAVSGMVAGVISPSYPWFKLSTHNPDLMQSETVKDWLYKAERLMYAIFASSNLYNAAPQMIGELLMFGTGAMSQEDDFENVARFYTHTAGSYVIGQNDRYLVDTFGKEFEATVVQMVEWFGYDKCSTAVKNRYDRGDYDAWYPVNHFVDPNPNFDPRSPLASKKPVRSVYYEPGNTGVDKNKFLRISGFNDFPIFAPRWEVTGEDVYGTDCPAMSALGDIKGLQVEEKRKAQAIDKMVSPPLKGPSSLRNVPINSLPGGITLYDQEPQSDGLKPIYEVQPRVQELMIDIEKVESRIKDAFFVNLFMTINEMEGVQPRNQLDIMSRNQEKLLQLGPVLEQLHGEWLGKMVDRTFNQCLRANLLPPAPPELQGNSLKVDYISTLAMAQRASTVGNIERAAIFTAQVAGLKPEVVDKFDADYAIEEYNTSLGNSPRLILPDEVVQQVRQQRAQQQQMQQLAQGIQMAAPGMAAMVQATSRPNNAGGAA